MAAGLAYLLLHALPVFAQQPADPPPAEPQVADPDPLPPPPPVWSGTGELTILATSGNVSSVTFGATGELARQKGRWRTNARAAFLRTTDRGLERGRSVLVQAQQSRAISSVLELFGRGQYQRDLFAGILQRYSVDAGAGLVFAGPVQRLQLTLGAGSTHERRLNVPDQSIPVATAGVQYRFALSQDTTFTEEALATSSLTHGDDWRLDSTAALTTIIRQPIALRVSYNTKYLNKPVPTFQRLDTLLSVSLVARF